MLIEVGRLKLDLKKEKKWNKIIIKVIGIKFKIWLNLFSQTILLIYLFILVGEKH